MKWIIFIFLVSCGSTKKSEHYSAEESALYIRLNSETTDPKLLALIQEGSESSAAEIILVTKLNDLDAFDDKEKDLSLFLANDKKKKRKKIAQKKKKNKKAKKKKELREKEKSSTCLTLASSCSVDDSRKKKNQKDIDVNVKNEAKIPSGKKIFRGARMKNRKDIQNKMLNGFDADPVGFDDSGKLKHKKKTKEDKNVYVTGRLSVQSALADASFDEGRFVKGGGKVVFSFQTKDDVQGVDLDKNSDELHKTKRAALKGRVSPDQILGYWDVNDNGDIGEFHENPYQSKSARVTTRIGNAFSSFFAKASDALKDGEDSKGHTEAKSYDPAIPGTIVPVSRTKK
ncbi:MAG: hypothetical protein AB8C84_07075 [Oligoflexales bacterium]